MSAKKLPRDLRRDTVKKIFVCLGPYKGRITLSILSAAVIVAVQLLIPVLTGKAIDLMIKGATEFAGVLNYIILIGISAGVSALFSWLLRISNNRVVYGISEDLRKKASGKINRLPLSYLDSHLSGDIVSRIISDVEQFSDGLLLGFTQFFSGILTILGTLIFMLVTNIRIALVVVLITPVSLLVAAFISKNTFGFFKLRNEIGGKQTALVNERIDGMKLVQDFGYEKVDMEQFEKINKEYTDATVKGVFFSSITNPSVRFVNNLVYAGVGLTGALSAISGGISIGQLSCFLSYANQYTKPFNEISGVVAEMQNAISCAARVFEFLEAEEMTEDPADPYELHIDEEGGDVTVEDVAFSYDPARPLIEHFNLNVDAGEKIAIVGPTGCGKTTFINLIMRFYDVDKGDIKVAGHSTRSMTRQNLRQNIGMVLQDTWIKHGTVAENIGYGLKGASMEDIIDAAKRAHCHSFIKRLPQGYDTEISETLGGLSQGQKQLLCIARVMLRIPPMLILDEATSNIDTRTEIRIQKAFNAMMEGRTTFIVAHRLSTIRNADLIIFMKDGKIMEQGTHEELLAKGGLYRELFDSQFVRT